MAPLQGAHGQQILKDGYIKLWIPNSPNAARLNDLRNLIAQPAELRKAFDRIYKEII